MCYIIVSNYIYSGVLEILVNINNHKHYLIINAKFHNSTINNAHTMSPFSTTLYMWSACLSVKHMASLFCM